MKFGAELEGGVESIPDNVAGANAGPGTVDHIMARRL
jgi:hypothetical protein